MSRTTVAVIGAGLMGSGIAATFVSRGFEVRIYDVRREAMEKAKHIVSRVLELLSGTTTGDSGVGGGALRLAESMREAVAGADFVFESIVEDLEEKRRLFEKLGRLTHSEVVLASNTSVIKPEDLARGLEAADRLLVVHWMNPPFVIPLVEVAATRWTRSDVLSRTVELLRRIGKTVILAPDTPGLIVNRFNAALIREALKLYAEFGASPETVDLAWTRHLGITLAVSGVFGNMDFIGLDTVLAAARHMGVREEDREALSVISRLVEEGRLGVKSGQGFYSYDDADFISTYLERAKKIWGVMKCLEEQR